MGRKRRNIGQNIITFSVLLISICALVVSIYQSRVMRVQQDLMLEQLKTSVWPRTEVIMRTGSIDAFEVTIENKGIGPAMVEQTRIKYKGEVITDLQTLLNKVTHINQISAYSSSVINGRVISPGEKVTMFSIQGDSAQMDFNEKYREIEIDVCYSSVYGDYWVFNRVYHDNRLVMKSTATEGCAIPESEAFTF